MSVYFYEPTYKIEFFSKANENYVINADFEDNLTAWTKTGVNTILDVSTYHSATHSATVDPLGDDGVGYITQTFNSIPIYYLSELSVWVRQAGATLAPYDSYISVGCSDMSEHTWDLTNNGNGYSSWTLIDLTSSVISFYSGKFITYIIIKNVGETRGTPVESWVDDISIKTSDYKLFGFGYGYNNKEVVSFNVKPGLTKTLGSFEVTIVDTGSNATGITTGNAFSNIDVFDTVKMWYGYTGSGLTPTVAEMFTGKIDTKEVSWSSQGCYRTFIGRDLGESLTRILERKMFTGSTSGSVIELKNDAGLSASNTFISGSTDLYGLVLENDTCFNGLNEISDFENKDFYTNTGSELHWFPRQSYVDSSTTFEEGLNIFDYRYFKDVANVKNDICVFGMTIEDPISGSYWPKDGDLVTQNNTYWWSGWFKALTGSTSTSLTVSTKTGTTPPGSPATGSACIYISRAGSQVEEGTEYEQHLMLNIDSGSITKLMLNSGNEFHSYLSYIISAPVPHTKIKPFLRLYSNTTGSDYFECVLERPIIIETLIWNERNIILGPTSEGCSATGSIGSITGSYRWTRNGNPDWYDIKYVDFGMNFIPSAFTTALSEGTYVDGVYFKVPFQYHTSGSASINTYGLRQEIMNVNKINSNLYAKNYGDTMLLMYQNPPIQIEMDTIMRPYQIGTSYPIIINSENINSNFELMDLSHVWNNGRLASKCLFTNQPQYRVPIPMIDFTTQQALKELSWWRKASLYMGGIPILASR